MIARRRSRPSRPRPSDSALPVGALPDCAPPDGALPDGVLSVGELPVGRLRVGRPPVDRSTDGAGDSGFAVVEFAVLFPLVLFAIALILQLSFWGYRRSVAIATAQDIAADSAARGNADSEFLHRQLTNHGLGGLDSLSTSVVVVAGAGGSERVRVSIDGSFPALIGPFDFPIHAVASATVERFRA